MKKITLVGDVMIGRLFNNRLSNTTHQVFSSEIKTHFKGSTLLIMNLETTLTNWKIKYPNKRFNYKLSTKYAKGVLFKLSKNIFCSLANNHILDYNVEGLKETLETLDSLNIYHTGAGLDLREAQKLVTININDTVVGFLSAADHYHYWAAKKNRAGIWYINPNNHEMVMEAMKITKEAKKRCDILIFSCHMQPNYVDNISNSIKKFYRNLIDNGVDIVHGHSPHHVLPIEKKKKGYILYSLGDFVDDYAISQKYRNDLGYLVDFYIKNKQIVKHKVRQTKIDNLQVDFTKHSSYELNQTSTSSEITPKKRKKKKKLDVHVTGFKPFGKYKENPSKKIAKLLCSDKIAQTYWILNVSKTNIDVDVDMYFSDINQIITLESTKTKTKTKTLLIHFGLNPNSENITIEMRAKNEFDCKKIDKKLSIDNYISTKIPIDKIKIKIKMNKKIVIGSDAGTWLCNYIYYRSLKFANKKSCFSLFVYLPLETVIPLKHQYDVVKYLVKTIKEILFY